MPSRPRNGTRRTMSAGVRPPRCSGIVTAALPNIPCTRVNARSARSSASVSPPQNPCCRPRAGITSSGASRSRLTPPFGLCALGPLSHPSSCQRTRSTMPVDDNAPSWRQIRSSRSPASVSITTSRRVHAKPSAPSCSCSSSAAVLAVNAAMSTRSAGGSRSATTSNDRCGGPTDDGRSSRPRASR